MGDADDAHPGIATGVAVGGELFEVGAVPDRRGGRVVGAQAGLLDELTRRCGAEILIGSDEPAGQCPSPLER